MPSDEFTGKVAVVSGAASGIGRSILTAFAERGAKCVIADMDTEWGPQVAADLRKSGHNVIFVPTNVSNSAHVTRLFDEAASTHGGIDIVVNTAGIRVRDEVVDLSEEDWDAQLNVQLKGTFLMCREGARRMIAQGRGGRLVNLGSNVVSVPHRGSAAHGVSKAGVVHLTKVMALELGRHNITVNVVAPSITEVAWPARKAALSPEFLRNFLPEVPLGNRLVRPHENVEAVLFFASERASFITGQTLYVDGGYSAGKMIVAGPTTPWKPAGLDDAGKAGA
jgi:3-oxoacyl-[acyl-carrier protein] reductase